MPKKRKQNKYDATQEKQFLKVFGDVFIMPIFRITQTLASERPHPFHIYRRNLAIDIIALMLLLLFLIYLGGRQFFLIRLYLFWYVAGGIAAIAYFGEIGHLFGLKTAGCPGKSATPI